MLALLFRHDDVYGYMLLLAVLRSFKLKLSLFGHFFSILNINIYIIIIYNRRVSLCARQKTERKRVGHANNACICPRMDTHTG